MDKDKIIIELDSLIAEGMKILKTKWSPSDSGIISFHTYVSYDAYISWKTKIVAFLKTFISQDNDYVVSFLKLEKHYYANTETCISLLINIKESIEKDFIRITDDNHIDLDTVLKVFFSRFHRVARQLRTRHNGRKTLEIEDEYDVQDLLHALFQLYFDDIRKEEWTPSYAGGSSRQDFLLKNEQTVIEVKKTRATMTDRDLGEQLIIDIEKYKNHPDCKQLICFVYDPEGRLGNPQGIMNDLNIQHKGFAHVIIKPD